MATYTIQLKNLIGSGFDIGLKDYPIFDEEYRKILNNKIIEHFYFREIGQETPELFKFCLNRKLKEIMPYYNQLYLSEKLNFDPFINFHELTTYTKNQEITDTYQETGGESGNSSKSDTASTTQNTSGNASENSLSVASDTPQGNIDIVQLKNNTYATNAQKSESETETSSELTENNESEGTAQYTTQRNNNSTNNRDFEERYNKNISGSRNENPSEMLLKYRQTLLNIDMMIIADLNELFMLLY